MGSGATVRMFRMDAGSNGAKFGRCGHDDGLTAATMTIDPIDNNSIRFDQAEEEKSKKRLGGGDFKGRSGDSLALEVAKGSGTIGVIAEKQNRWWQSNAPVGIVLPL